MLAGMSSMRRTVAGVTAPLVLVVAPSSALSSARKLRVVASAPGENYPATTTAVANTIPHPRALHARLTDDPRQVLSGAAVRSMTLQTLAS
jgi:hypothetical protein